MMKQNRMTRPQALRKLNAIGELFQTKPGDDAHEVYRKARQADHVHKYVIHNAESFAKAPAAAGLPVANPPAGLLLAAVQRVQAAMGEVISVAEGREFNPAIVEEGKLALQEANSILQEL